MAAANRNQRPDAGKEPYHASAFCATSRYIYEGLFEGEYHFWD